MPSDVNGWFDGLTKSLDAQSEKKREFIERWNAENKPIREQEIEGETIGVYCFDGVSFHWAAKKRNGYHPHEMIEIPKVAIDAIRQAIKEGF